MALVTTGFRPSTHGWPFQNGFTYAASLIGLEVPISNSFGLCGGMCLSALDRFKSCLSIPRSTPKPTQGSALYNELLDRQIDSLRVGNNFIWAKVYDWQRRPDRGHRWPPRSLAYLTRRQWPSVKKSIDQGTPITLCLIQVEGYTANPTENHQVLAYQYDYQPTSKNLVIWVYDPNDPNNDDVRVTLNLAGRSLRGNRNNTSKRMRGFFRIPWSFAQVAADLKLVKLDFVPTTGESYDLNWPGPPRHNLNYSEVKHYQPILELDKPTPQLLRLMFWVKEERTAWPNPTLGSFVVEFGTCSTKPTDIRTSNYGVGGRPPTGSPTFTQGSFWLGATKKGKVRGNEGKGDDGYARVYIEASTVFGVAGKSKSPRHTVRAV